MEAHRAYGSTEIKSMLRATGLRLAPSTIQARSGLATLDSSFFPSTEFSTAFFVTGDLMSPFTTKSMENSAPVVIRKPTCSQAALSLLISLEVRRRSSTFSTSLGKRRFLPNQERLINSLRPAYDQVSRQINFPHSLPRNILPPRYSKASTKGKAKRTDAR